MTMRAREVYNGSDGGATRAYYGELMKRGPIGEVAVNLFRASKCSARAKLYRGGIRGRGSYKDMAYDRKNWSLAQLVNILDQRAAELNINYGWKRDPRQAFHSWCHKKSARFIEAFLEAPIPKKHRAKRKDQP